MMVVIGLAGAFLVGILLGSMTMSMMWHNTMEREIAKQIMSTLDWVERMEQRGRLPEAIAETRAWWKLKIEEGDNNGTY